MALFPITSIPQLLEIERSSALFSDFRNRHEVSSESLLSPHMTSVSSADLNAAAAISAAAATDEHVSPRRTLISFMYDHY